MVCVISELVLYSWIGVVCSLTAFEQYEMAQINRADHLVGAVNVYTTPIYEYSTIHTAQFSGSVQVKCKGGFPART